MCFVCNRYMFICVLCVSIGCLQVVFYRLLTGRQQFSYVSQGAVDISAGALQTQHGMPNTRASTRTNTLLTSMDRYMLNTPRRVNMPNTPTRPTRQHAQHGQHANTLNTTTNTTKKYEWKMLVRNTSEFHCKNVTLRLSYCEFQRNQLYYVENTV